MSRSSVCTRQWGRDSPGDLYIADGRIAEEFARPDRIIDDRGMVVAPGFVDMAARLREPGFEYKATLESELEADEELEP